MPASYRANVPLSPAVPQGVAVRKCLGCHAPFASWGSANRLCPYCTGHVERGYDLQSLRLAHPRAQERRAKKLAMANKKIAVAIACKAREDAKIAKGL